MTSQAVPWRRVVVVLAAVAVALGGTIVAIRADGFAAIDAAVPRVTRWFVHDDTDSIVLADGFTGRALARLDAVVDGEAEVVQSASGAAVLDRGAATARSVELTELRLGSPQQIGLLRDADVVVGFGQSGLVAVDPESGDAVIVPNGADPVTFSAPAGVARENTHIGPDGAVWSLVDGGLVRTSSRNDRVVVATGLGGDATFALAGTTPLIVDPARRSVRFGAGSAVRLPPETQPSEIVVQAHGPSSSCGWLGADDRLWCVGPSGIEHDVTIADLDIDGGDRLAVAGDAAALVRRSNSSIVRLDWRAGTVSAGDAASVPPNGQLSVDAGPDLVWVDQTDGRFAWAINPWGIRVIEKDDDSVPLIGATGEVLEPGEGPRGGSTRGGGTEGQIDRQPDRNGIDDPPIAVDDPVTARTGAAVQVDVTANDYDPDGEAIVLMSTSSPRGGTVEISTASTVTYRPNTGFTGIDQFTYTIADGDGTEASATVTLELLAADALNREPVGEPDFAQTGPEIDVVIDVLLNDIDPERDALRIDSFTQPVMGGSVIEVVTDSGVPGLLFEPPVDAVGTAEFTYRPVDSFGAVGEPVAVEVEIAARNADNAAPIVRPDAVRVRRDRLSSVAVLANDRDPDGDRLRIELPDRRPDGVELSVNGGQIDVIARAGARTLTPVDYFVDDGNGNRVATSLLIALVEDSEPNRAPLANADSVTVVAGTTQLIDVLANDSDPDGDPITLVSVRRDGDGGAISVRGDRVAYVAPTFGTSDEQLLDQFEYTITDGNGERSTAQVTVRVLPEPLGEPPYAQDDVVSTTVDVAVTFDVLRNDGDPSGERPSIVGTPGCPGGGSAVVTQDNRVRYTPPPGRDGTFTCTYEVANSQGLRDSAQILINVERPEPANRAPIAVNNRIRLVTGESRQVNVVADDTDPDGPDSSLTLVGIGDVAFGTAEVRGNVIIYTAGEATGVINIEYQVADVEGAIGVGNLTVEVVAPAPVAPVTNDDQRTILGPGVATPFEPLENDVDPDGNVEDLRVQSAQLVGGEGELERSGRTVILTPDPDFVGTMVAEYVVVDPDGLTATGRIILTVTEPLNRSPIALDDAGEVISGGTVTIRLALNDSDPDGDNLSYRIVTPPDSSLGLASLDGSNLVFSAIAGASGEARVVYEVSDGEATANATARVRILACTDADPVAPDQFLQTGYQQPIDIDLTTIAQNGEVVEVSPPLSEAVGTYTPPPGENGNIVITYVVRNSCGVQAIGTVTIDVNQDPVGDDYTATIGRQDPIQIPVSELASDQETLTIVELIDNPTWVTVSADGGAILANPAGQAVGAVFTAVIADPGGLSVSVTVTIALANRPPIAGNDTVSSAGGIVTFSPLLNDSDPDGDAITLAAVPQVFTFADGTTGTITRLADDALQLDPQGGSGEASFTYTIVDSAGLASEPATVSFSVNGIPTAPSRIDESIPEGQPRQVPVNASDPDGDPITLSLLGDPAPLIMSVSGLTITVLVPAGTPIATYEVGFRVTDSNGAFVDGVLAVTVTPPAPPTTTTSPPTTTTTVP